MHTIAQLKKFFTPFNAITHGWNVHPLWYWSPFVGSELLITLKGQRSMENWPTRNFAMHIELRLGCWTKRYWTLCLIKNRLEPQFRRTASVRIIFDHPLGETMLWARLLWLIWRKNVRFFRGNKSVSGKSWNRYNFNKPNLCCK